MTTQTRKRIWPVSLMMSLAIIGGLAALVVLAANPGATQAHGASDHEEWCANATRRARSPRQSCPGIG